MFALQVFGRTVICRDLDVATNVARTAELDCITLEGNTNYNRQFGLNTMYIFIIHASSSSCCFIIWLQVTKSARKVA